MNYLLRRPGYWKTESVVAVFSPIDSGSEKNPDGACPFLLVRGEGRGGTEFIYFHPKKSCSLRSAPFLVGGCSLQPFWSRVPLDVRRFWSPVTWRSCGLAQAVGFGSGGAGSEEFLKHFTFWNHQKWHFQWKPPVNVHFWSSWTWHLLEHIFGGTQKVWTFGPSTQEVG